MEDPTHYPLLVFAAALVAMWLASMVGLWLRNRQARAGDKRSEDIDLIVAATLTLLALIIGFSFSMATSRYDQRKNLEAAEANAIGTEYLRADLLPAADAANVRRLLVAYLGQRIVFYGTGDLARDKGRSISRPTSCNQSYGRRHKLPRKRNRRLWQRSCFPA